MLKRDGRRIVNQTIFKRHVIKLSSLSSQDKLKNCSMLGKINFPLRQLWKLLSLLTSILSIDLFHVASVFSAQDRQQVQEQETDNIQANMHGLPKPYSSFNSTLFLIFNCFFLFIGKHTGGKESAFVHFCKFSTHSAFLAPYQQTAVCIPAQGINLVPVDTNSSALYPFPPASWKAFSLLKSPNLCK